MKDLDDSTLVRRALQADPASFGELCRRYYHSLVAIADSVLLDHHLAEDAAQETLAAACRELDRLKAPERFGPWLASICRNVARDMRRDSQKQRRCVERSLAGDGPGEPDDYCLGEPDDEQRAVLAAALARLPEPLREVLFLRFYNEMSYRQVAQVLGATEQVIDGRIRRAKKKLAILLNNAGFGR
ncbi:MAG: sigma-70 family RNA polymerase sigma factor [Phycisphaerae bacterium]|nr:sigma-70 family RNA polymerase sigma factor [Phycisphaerae bacterium]